EGKVEGIGGGDEGSMEMFNPESERFTAFAHLAPSSDSVSEVLRARTRAALIYESSSGGFRLQMALPQAMEDLLNRSAHSLVDMPDAGTALVAGGQNSRGE